ncbi:hypothetical protein B0A50_03554 [Salinomyces thailandicus]|uniref:NAD(P)-binding protein n=1 Tax=Salinomyces thailandicus TaxID=706561 RepID=A0A4U0U3D2_9PEZI|nr:hypothetical protein B0A50_03554 [Salinomyces thailandica]
MTSSSTTSAPFDLSLGLDETHVLITGGCGLIGRVVVQAFLAADANVTVVDIISSKDAESILDLQTPGLQYIPADITLAGEDNVTHDAQGNVKLYSITHAFTLAEDVFGTVSSCIALASLDLSVLNQSESLCDMDPSEWQKVFDVNLHGTFLTAQRWLQGIRSATQDPAKAAKLKNVSLVLMGSESGTFGVRTMPAYAAAKSAVQVGLLRSLAKDAPRIYSRGRVNAVAPGAVATERFEKECRTYGERWRYEECEATVGLGRAVSAEDVARGILGLASERWSGSVHGQCVAIDGGKVGSVVWSPGEVRGTA